MSPAMLHSWWTVLLLVAFVGIIAWAWSSRRKRAFDEAARLPLEDDAVRAPTGDKNHG